MDAGFTKDDIRCWSRALGLRTWDKPAAACLASRLPYGTPVTLGRLGAVEAAEVGVAGARFRQLRVRHYGDAARIELEPARAERGLAAGRGRRGGAGAGYRYVTLDLEGFGRAA